MLRTKNLPAAAGILVAAMGLTPLAVMVLNPAEPVDTSTTTSSPAPELVELAPRDIDGLDPRVSRVLYAFGAADAVAPGSTAEIPESIVKVLAYYDVTLTIPSGGSQ